MSFSYLQILNQDGQGPEIYVDTQLIAIALDPSGTSPAMGGSIGTAFANQAVPTRIAIYQGAVYASSQLVYETGAGLAAFPASGAWQSPDIDAASFSAPLVSGEKLWMDVEWDDGGVAGAETSLELYLNNSPAVVAFVTAAQAAQAAAAVEGSFSFDGSLPADYASMDALQGRMKIDSTQIKHRLHTADYQNGGYKPSMPATATNEADADYKAFPAPHTVTALREAAEDGLAGASSTIPYVIEMDMIEAQIARLLDSDMQINFDGESPVWKAESNESGGAFSPLLTAKGDLEVVRNLDVGGDATVSGDIVADGDATIGGNVDIDGSIDVGGDAVFQNNVDIQGILEVDGQSVLTGAVEMRDDLHVEGNLDAASDVTVGSDLSVAGTSQLSGNVDADSDLKVAGQLLVHGSVDMDLTGGFDVDSAGDINIDSSSSLASAIQIIASAGGVTIDGGAGVDLKGDVQSHKDFDVDQDLLVKGDATLMGNATLKSDLEVQGVSTLKDDVAMQANLDVDGNVDIGGSAVVQHEMSVDGDATFAQDLDIAGATTVSGDLSVAGSVDIDATTFDVDATGNISMASDANITLDASAGILKLDGANGVEFNGPATFEQDVTIKDQLVIINDGSDDAEEPDFKIMHGTAELVHFDGSNGGMEVNIEGDVTIGGSLVVTEALEVDGTTVNVVATVSTMGDNIIEINKDNSGAHKSVGILLDGASSERDFFFGINKDQDRFVLSKEAAAGGWDADSDNGIDALDEDKKSDISDSRVDAAELHAGDARFEGVVDIASDLKVGGASPTLHVDSAAAEVLIDGDAIVEAQVEVHGILDVDGAADIKNDLQITGKLEVDYSADVDGLGNAGYRLTVDDAAAGTDGLEGTDSAADLEGNSISGGRLALDSGTAHMVLKGDLEVADAKLARAVVEGEFQAFGSVGLGNSSSKVRVFGEFEAAKSAKFQESLRVHHAGSGDYDLLLDAAEQSAAGLAISSRELDVSNGAFMQLADGKDALFQGDVGVKGMLALGGDLWFAKHLRSKAEFLMQDSFTDGTDGVGNPYTYDDKGGTPHQIMGYTLAASIAQIQAVLSNAPAAEAVVDIDGDKHISIMGILGGLIAGGSTLRYEYELTGFIAKDSAFDLDSGSGAPVIHPNDSDAATLAEYKDSLRLFHNGQRLSNDDYELVYSADAAEAGRKLKLNFAIEKDDVLILDINDTNPAA